LKPYDFLIVGAGLFGATFAYEASKRGKKCLVIDKRPHIGGNIYTEIVNGINVHKYGPHIFHTNNKAVWEYINRFAELNNYVNSPIANYNGEIYNLPFNMNTFNKMWGAVTPQEAMDIITSQRQCANEFPRNLEEQAISSVGLDIYEKLIKGYTEKQWMRNCADLPTFIIKRLPVRFTYDNNYYTARYQGIPMGGYTQIAEKLLEGSEVLLNTDFFVDRGRFEGLAEKIIYTGAIDGFFDYRFGELEYRSVYFESEELQMSNYQGNAIVNYTDRKTPYTRIIEHKHFEFGRQETTIISREYSVEWKRGDEPYYPINDEHNQNVLQKYQEYAASEPDVIFGGRLGEYKYYDMDTTIESALRLAAKILT
jgi:UDP-galactopyranose mutase